MPNIGSAPTCCRSAVPDSPSPPASREDQGCYHRRLATHLRKGSFWSYGRRRRLLRALDARFMSYPDAVHFGHPIPRKQRRSQQPPFIAGKSPSAGCGKALPAREPSVSPPFLAKNSTWEPERGPEVPSARRIRRHKFAATNRHLALSPPRASPRRRSGGESGSQTEIISKTEGKSESTPAPPRILQRRIFAGLFGSHLGETPGTPAPLSVANTKVFLAAVWVCEYDRDRERRETCPAKATEGDAYERKATGVASSLRLRVGAGNRAVARRHRRPRPGPENADPPPLSF